MKRYAIIGFGGLGKKHFLNMLEIEKERNDIHLVAICNSTIEGIFQNVTINIGTMDLSKVDFSKYNLYTDYKEMLEKENLDFVIITLPSYMHHPVATYCLEHGVDVFCEKPMAVTLEECEDMMNVAEKTGRRLMIGQVARFSPFVKYLKHLIETGKYGKPVKAEFSRRSALPTWSFENWLLDDKKSGGCVVDLSIHDIDTINYLFGTPEKFSVASTHNMTKYESIYALYQYKDFVATVTADWGIPAKYEFKAELNFTFENAYIEQINGVTKIYTGDSCEEIVFDKANAFIDEIVEFIDGIIFDKPFTTVSTESVYETMKFVFAQKDQITKDMN